MFWGKPKTCAGDTPRPPPQSSHPLVIAARPNQAADSSLPSTRRRVPEGASPPQTPPFARLDIGIGYRIPMGEVVVPRPCDHPRITKGSEGSGVRVRVREPYISARRLPAVFIRVRGSGFGTPLWVGRRKPTHRGHPRKPSVPDSVKERRAELPATRKGATARAVTPHA